MTDTLTENGIEADEDDHEELLATLREEHGDPVGESEKSFVFALDHGHELDEWAAELNVDREELAERMEELAREKADYNWGTYEPFVVAR